MTSKNNLKMMFRDDLTDFNENKKKKKSSKNETTVDLKINQMNIKSLFWKIETKQ